MAVKTVTLFFYFGRHIEWLCSSGKGTTASNYQSTWRMVSKYLDRQAEKFCLSAITEEWVQGFVEWLSGRGNLKASSVNYYLRYLRALYGLARKEKLIAFSDKDPFRGLAPSVPPTSKRSLSEGDLDKLVGYGERPGVKAGRIWARDVFLFLFYTRGMCFVDVYNLKKSDIHGDYIYYRRSKTGAALQVKIVSEVKRLIEKHGNPESEYVFPFLRENKRGEGELDEKSSLRRLNRHLKLIGKELGITQPLTTYVARHTWASLTEACGMNTSIISQGLGHSSERVTRIYMKGMPSHVIGNANEEMLNRLVRRKKKKKKGKNKKCPFLGKKETRHRINYRQR